MKNYYRILSLLLVFVFVFLSTNVVFAGYSTSNMTLDVSTVPEVLNVGDMINAGHIQRDYSSEDSLNSVAFKNQDGSGAMYFFDHPIKYIDKYGNQKDKNNTLVETENGHTNPNNNINILYPDHISDGLDISYGEYAITITPIKSTDATNTSQMSIKTLVSESSITYSNVFADNVDINYSQTYNGMKENIILREKSELSSFSYMVYTGGLAVTETNGELNYISPNDGKLIMSCGKLLSWDNNDVYGYANYEVTTIKSNQIYIITINAEEFLGNDQLEYPVIIDPEMHFNFETLYKDVTIFEDYTTNFGEYFTMFIGDFNARYPDNQNDVAFVRGKARFFVAFQNIFSGSTVQSLYNEGKITGLKYTFVDRGRDVNTTIQAYMCTRSWNEATVTNASDPMLWNSYNTMLDKVDIPITTDQGGSMPRYELDITAALDTWMTDPNVNNGIMLKAEDETKVAFLGHTREAVYHGQSINTIPYVKLEYGNHSFDGKIVMFKNVNSGQYLTVEDGYKYSGQDIYTRDKINGIEDSIDELHSNSQKFRIRYDEAAQAYRIYAMCSMYGRGTVLDVLRTRDGRRALEAGCSLETYTPNDNEAQLFLITPAGNGHYNISFDYNTNLAIDVVSGNVELANLNTSSNSQKWVIEMVDNDSDYYYSHMDVRYPFHDNVKTTVSSSYGYREHNIDCHPGTDFVRANGIDIYSLFNGIIVDEGFVSSGRGNYIIVEAVDDGYEVFKDSERTKLRFCFMHMESRISNYGLEEYNEITDNDSGKVTFQTQLGEVGNSGLNPDPPNSGYHLHISIITDCSTTTNSFSACEIDPLVFFDDIEFDFDL